jgi:hypothetical protein
MSDERDTNWTGPKGTVRYRSQGNADPAPPLPLHKPAPLKIDRALMMIFHQWTRQNRFAIETYYREGKGVYEKESTL